MTDKILTHVENHIGWVIYNNAEKEERRLYGHGRGRRGRFCQHERR